MGFADVVEFKRPWPERVRGLALPDGKFNVTAPGGDITIAPDPPPMLRL
jgi:hypothetical protein